MCDAIIKSGPREDLTRINRPGTVSRKAKKEALSIEKLAFVESRLQNMIVLPDMIGKLRNLVVD